MTSDIYLGKILGVPFRLHWSWFLAVFLIAWTLAAGFFPDTLPEYRDEGGLYWLLGILAALGLFASILLHELGHAVVARRFRVKVRGIRLFIFGGVAELGAEPKKPGHEVLIALGGPAVTVVLIALYFTGVSLLLGAGGVDGELTQRGLTLGGGAAAAGAAALLFYLGMINTVVLVFNMVPAFPLDGGRVLRGIVWAVTDSYLTGTRVAGGVGIAFSWLLFLGGFMIAFGEGYLLGGLWLFFLGMFLQNAAQSSIAYAQLQHLLRGVTVADMMRREPVTLDAGLTLAEAADRYFLRHPYKAYPVVEGGKFLGMLTLRAMQELGREGWEAQRAGDAVARQGPQPALRPGEPVLRAMQKMAEAGQGRLPVLEGESLVGLLCRRDVMDYLEVRAGLASPREEEKPVSAGA